MKTTPYVILRTITIKEVLIIIGDSYIGSDSLESVRIFFVSSKALKQYIYYASFTRGRLGFQLSVKL
jgi:hypothetical protein